MAKSPREKVALAKQKIAFQWRFLTPKMFDLKFVEQPGVGTACTDGVHVWWDPDYIEQCNISQTMFVCVHEPFHPLRKHHIRFLNMKDYDHRIANIAMDASINNMIVDEMKLELPPGAVYMPQYRGWAWEDIYRDLVKNKDQTPIWDEVIPYPGRGDDDKDGKDGKGGKGGPEPGQEKADAGEARAEERRIEGQLKEMERIGKKAGKLPGSFSDLVKGMTETKVPWQHVLARFVDENSNKDYDWLAPDENYINGDIYIPTLHDPKIGKVVILFDTSGSVGTEDFKKFRGGLHGILTAYDTEITCIEVDYIVQKVFNVVPADLNHLEITFNGRGGTSFEPGFEYIKENDLQPKVALYFTDGECDCPAEAPDYPVLWCLLNRGHNYFKPTFGEVITID